jgi:hypothetical protein
MPRVVDLNKDQPIGMPSHSDATTPGMADVYLFEQIVIAVHADADVRRIFDDDLPEVNKVARNPDERTPRSEIRDAIGVAVAIQIAVFKADTADRDELKSIALK